MTSAEIRDAMRGEKPVKSGGETFKKITAYILRSIKDEHTGVIMTILQCELLDESGNSVTIVPAESVTI